MIARMLGLAALVATLAGAPAAAKELVFTTTMTGDQAPTVKDSKATGRARMVVDTERRTVDLTLDVDGLTIGQLWDRLVAAPVGPIHLHAYGHDHSGEGASVTLALPVVFGPNYTATPKGFRVTLKGYDYAQGAALVKSTTSFDGFVASLSAGLIVLNIHTDRAHDGEISGTMKPAA